MKFPQLFKPRYGIEKVLLAFEYGVILSQVAKEQGIQITPELVAKAEKMIEGEFTSQSADHLAGHMTINILSAFELDITK